MQEKIRYLASWIIVLVAFARFAVVAVFLPFAATPWSREWNFAFAPILVMIAAAILSFTRYRFISVAAAVVAFVWTCAQLLSSGWIWVFSSTGFWGIVPSACLVIATTAKWLAMRREQADSVSQSMSEYS
jgi:hypothetical protein